METCKAITIRFEETLIVQEHSTLKHGAFLGLKKRGNCTQLLEKTLREGKGPNHFFFFFFLFPLPRSFKTFHPSYRLKTISNQPNDSPFPPRIDTSLPAIISSLSHPLVVFLQLRANFSLFRNVYYVFHSHSWLRVRRQVCAFLQPTAPLPPLFHPVLLPFLSLSLCAFYTERALLEFTYPTIETNRVIYTFAAIWAHTAERRAEMEGEGACTTPLKIQTSDTSNK